MVLPSFEISDCSRDTQMRESPQKMKGFFLIIPFQELSPLMFHLTTWTTWIKYFKVSFIESKYSPIAFFSANEYCDVDLSAGWLSTTNCLSLRSYFPYHCAFWSPNNLNKKKNLLQRWANFCSHYLTPEGTQSPELSSHVTIADFFIAKLYYLRHCRRATMPRPCFPRSSRFSPHPSEAWASRFCLKYAEMTNGIDSY